MFLLTTLSQLHLFYNVEFEDDWEILTGSDEVGSGPDCFKGTYYPRKLNGGREENHDKTEHILPRFIFQCYIIECQEIVREQNL
jgi:hypothetical protein